MFHKACTVAALLGFFCLPVGAEDLGKIAFSFDGKDHEWPTITRQASGKTIASARLTKTRLVNTMTIDAYEKQTDSRGAILNVQLLYATEIAEIAKSVGKVCRRQAGARSQPRLWTADIGRHHLLHEWHERFCLAGAQ